MTEKNKFKFFYEAIMCSFLRFPPHQRVQRAIAFYYPGTPTVMLSTTCITPGV